MNHLIKLSLVITTLLVLVGCADKDYKEIQSLYEDIQSHEKTSKDPESLIQENQRISARIESYLSKNSSGDKASSLKTMHDSLKRQADKISADYKDWKLSVGSLPASPSYLSELRSCNSACKEFLQHDRSPVLVNLTKAILEKYQKMGPEVLKKEFENILINLDGDMEKVAKNKAGNGGCIVPISVEVSEDKSAREGTSGETSIFSKRGYYVRAKCLTTEKSDYVSVRATISADTNNLSIEKTIN